MVGELDQVGEAVRRERGDVVAGHRRGLVGWGLVRVAVVGTVFFSELDAQSFTDAFTRALPIVVGLFLVAAVLALTLPRTAVAEGGAEAAA
jgi:hypothetical protein